MLRQVFTALAGDLEENLSLPRQRTNFLFMLGPHPPTTRL